jgi:hypothetical protein
VPIRFVGGGGEGGRGDARERGAVCGLRWESSEGAGACGSSGSLDGLLHRFADALRAQERRTDGVEKIWMGELKERLRNALRLLSISVDLSGASEESMKEVCELLVRLEKAISELSIHAGNQLDQIQKTKRR